MRNRLDGRCAASSSLVLLVALFTAAACLTAAAVPAAAQSAVLVRGRVDRKGKTRTYPAAYVKVTLVPRVLKGRNEHTTVVYTGTNGIFSFRAWPDEYLLQVWVSENQSKDSVILVRGNQRSVNVAPIVIP